LAVLPGSVKDAQANPCSTSEQGGGDVDTEINCDFEGIGSLEIYVHSNDNDNVPLEELPLPTQ
ncbi:MAG: hypothetical protein WAL24_09775, partial [Nitrososphaeraceae archaeon]